MTRKILIAIDASENAENAFEFYVKWLHKPENQIIVLSCCETPNLPVMTLDAPFSFPKERWQEEMTKHVNASKSLEEKYSGRLVQLKLNYKMLLKAGAPPGQTIIQVAEEEKVDQIVMGSRGLNKLRRTFLGSVSDYVILNAGVPVTVCPPETKTLL